jgi:F0F1-type ATP synthase epsilon subunit
MGDDLISVTITNREQIVFKGVVKSLTSINGKGEFDVLGRHQNFISLIFQKIVLVPMEGKPITYEIDHGILHVLKNEVKVFLGIGVS